MDRIADNSQPRLAQGLEKSLPISLRHERAGDGLKSTMDKVRIARQLRHSAYSSSYGLLNTMSLL